MKNTNTTNARKAPKDDSGHTLTTIANNLRRAHYEVETAADYACVTTETGSVTLTHCREHRVVTLSAYMSAKECDCESGLLAVLDLLNSHAVGLRFVQEKADSEGLAVSGMLDHFYFLNNNLTTSSLVRLVEHFDYEMHKAHHLITIGESVIQRVKRGEEVDPAAIFTHWKHTSSTRTESEGNL